MFFRFPRSLGARLFVVGFHLAMIVALIVYLVVAIIHATHSDTDISLLMKKLLPAGNCLCESSTTFDCRLSLFDQHANGVSLNTSSTTILEDDWQFQYERDHLNFGLGEAQCLAAFPGYFEEVFRAFTPRNNQHDKISVDELDAIEIFRGMVRAMIVNGKLRVLKSKHMDEDHRKKGLAILHSISRSISTSEGTIPNIEFVFSIEDMVKRPSQPIWTLSRRSQDHNLWLMPDFGFWGWDLQDLGTLDDVAEQVMRYETTTAMENKIPQLVWRGKLQMLPRLRRALLDVSKDKSWSDVEGLKPGSSLIPENYISAADQCKYMFIAHAEGRSTTDLSE